MPNDARQNVIDRWDEHVCGWLASNDELSEPFASWWASYTGTGPGKPTRTAMPEPFIGNWRSARLVMLGLNPGAADLTFQGREGHFAARVHSEKYAAWAASDPYASPKWEAVHGPNRYRAARLRFADRWLADEHVTGADLLIVELYPWHSRRVTAAIAPPPAVLDEFVWNPLREVDVERVFAFGAPWRSAARELGLEPKRRFGAGSFASPGRQAVTFARPSGQELVVVWQSGYAGPPGPRDTERLRELL